jgi:viroplasmin and RNaseH domain-containing protein
MAYKYCVAECWGTGFITNDDSSKFQISGFPGNLWQIPADNRDANLWVSKVAGTFKTKEEAQAIVDAEVALAQADWDALPDAQKQQPFRQRPTAIVLE